MIKQSDSLFSEELSSCDGSTDLITQNAQCTIESVILNQAPFSIAWGSSVYAKIVTLNDYGESAESDEGNGGVILTNPDAPHTLVEMIAGRT
jgi:hypothetical protein